MITIHKKWSVNRTNLKRIVSLACVSAIALGILSAWQDGKAANLKHGAHGKHRGHGKDGAELVRWDIISINPLPAVAGSKISAGGEASAFAYHTPTNPSAAKISLTGFGTFIAPASGGGSSAVTGGGTWETSGAGLPTASGIYRVTKLVDWQFGNFQTGGPAFIDEIGDSDKRANGNAVLLIEYDDGSEGVLGVGCHGPGAPNGILEGVIATKGHLTYWNGELPVGNVDANRTVFHLLR